MGSTGSKQQSSQPIDEASCLREKKLQEDLKVFQDQLAQKNQEFQQSQMMLQELVQSQIDLTRKVNGIESSSNISRDNLAEQLSSIKQDLSENLHASRISQQGEEKTNLGQIAFEDRIKEEYSKISEENTSKIQENYAVISTRILNAEGQITALTEDLQESKKYHGKIDENSAKIIEIQASANEQAITSKIIEETNQQFQKGIKPVSGNIARLQSDLQKQLNKLETLEKTLQEFIKEKDAKENNNEDDYKKGIEQSLRDLESKIGQVVEKQKQLESSITGSSDYAKESDVKNIRKQLLEVKADVLRMEKKKSEAISAVEGVIVGGTSSDAIIIEETVRKPSLSLGVINKSTIKNEIGGKLERKISISSSDSENEEDSEGSSSGSMPQKKKIIVKGQQSKNMQEITASKKLEIPLSQIKSSSKQQISLSQSSIKEEATPSQKQKNKNNNNSNNSTINQESTPKNSVQTFSSQIATKPTLGQTPTAKANTTPSQRQNTSGTTGGVQIDAQNPFKFEGKKGNKNFKTNKQE